LARIPWDPLKHPRGRDGRFIEKYGIDAFTAAKSKITQSLDPNITPTTGRTSDDIRPLLEHLNLLDQSQLHHLAADYEVAPNQTSKSPFADAIHRQIEDEDAPNNDFQDTSRSDSKIHQLHYPEPITPTITREVVDPETGEMRTMIVPNPRYKAPNQRTPEGNLLGVVPNVPLPKLPDPLDAQIDIHKYETNSIVYKIWKTFGRLTYRQLHYLDLAYARAAEIAKDLYYNGTPPPNYGGMQCGQYADVLAGDQKLQELFAKAGFRISKGHVYPGHEGVYIYKDDGTLSEDNPTNQFFTIHVGSGANPLHHTPWGPLWPLKTSFPDDWLMGFVPHSIEPLKNQDFLPASKRDKE
jgi:hypothetical protein